MVEGAQCFLPLRAFWEREAYMGRDFDVSISGKLMLPGGLTDGMLGISDGRIAAIKKDLIGETHYDYSDHIVIPSAVDMHVHFRQPGDARKGTFATESKAAAFGGVTTVADMPNTSPPSVDLRSWKAKLDEVKGTSYVDYLLYMGISGTVEPLTLGVATGLFKLYIASSTGDLFVRDHHTWTNALAAALVAGGRVVVHAEDQDAIEAAVPTGEELEYHHTSRPALGEAAAVERVAMAASTTTVPGHAHIAHVSCKEALAALGTVGCSAEVAPHHLFLDIRREDLGAFGKVNPPLRTDTDRGALWAALVDGRLPILASDHAPHTQEEKSLNFRDAPSGMPGVETIVPMAMYMVKHGKLPLMRLVEATALRPAEFLDLQRRGLEVGLAAHIAVYDPRGETKIRADDLHHNCGWTPYEDMPAIFPSLVVSPTGVLVHEGEPQQSRPTGRYAGKTLEELGA
jgi:dihydroorotase